METTVSHILGAHPPFHFNGFFCYSLVPVYYSRLNPRWLNLPLDQQTSLRRHRRSKTGGICRRSVGSRWPRSSGMGLERWLEALAMQFAARTSDWYYRRLGRNWRNMWAQCSCQRACMESGRRLPYIFQVTYSSRATIKWSNHATSLDQTTRIHGEMATDNSSIWHEIARPQVHGYDLLRVAFLSPLRFVSIADEKVARVFEAPREFIETSKNIGISRFQAETVGCISYLFSCAH